MSITETCIEVWNRGTGIFNISETTLSTMAHDVAFQFTDGRTSPDKVQMLARMILSDLADSQCGNTGCIREKALSDFVRKPGPSLPPLEDIEIP